MSVFSQLMMRKKGSFKILDFIQSHGKQYIDTGFVPNQDTKIEMVCEVLVRSNSPYLFGAGQGWENKAFALAFNATVSNGLIFCYGNNTAERSGSGFNVNVKYKVTFGKEGGYVLRLADGVQTYTGSLYSAQTFSAGANALIFWTNNLGSGTDYAESMKLYSLKIWDNGTLVRDYVPVLNQATGERGVLDNVENKFYGNSGVGEFLGSDQIILTKVGSPTITDGVVSGFSSSNYLTMAQPFILNSTTKAEFSFDITTGNIGSINGLMATLNSYGLSFIINSSGALRLYMGNGSSWSLLDKTGTTVLSANTTYNIKLRINEGVVTVLINNVVEFTTNITIGTEYTYNLSIGVGRLASQYWQGEFNSNTSYLTINGTKYNYVIA